MARRRSRGFQRQVRRKFIWDRVQGSMPVGQGGPFAADLLADFRNQPGATHVGATVMRVRGYIRPVNYDTGPNVGGIFGMRVDSWNSDPIADSMSPIAQPEEDWMAWLPWSADQITANEAVASWNSQASVWAVDVKAGRKIEELHQTLWLCTTAPAQGTQTVVYDLSIGLKLP